MKYVKLTAENYNEALQQLRTKYGEDAIPISHKYIKEGGLFNSRFFAKEIVELTAAIHEKKMDYFAKKKKPSIDLKVDDDISDTVRGRLRVESEENEERGLAGQKSRPYKFSNDQDFQFDRETVKTSPEAEREPRQYSYGKQSNETSYQSEPVKKDAVEISNDEYQKLKNFEKEFYEVKASLNRLLEKQVSSAAVAERETEDETSPLQQYRDILKSNDFTDEECSSLLKDLKKDLTESEMKEPVKIEKTLKELIESRIVTSGAIKVSGKKKIIMFVGPTGVGKTTSLAKMGAYFSLRENKKVAFVTIDTYRIAATEQLKKYAEIMRIPIHVISDQKKFKDVMEHEDADVILVDTSGRSHRNKLKISEIKSYADQVDYDFEKLLCVSATTKRNDLADIFNSFDDVGYNSVLITKVDETSFVGNVVKVADKYNKPISYIADGQEVPNDLHVASSNKIAELMVAGNPEV